MKGLAITPIVALATGCVASPVYVLSEIPLAGFASTELLQARKVSRSGVIYERVRGEALRRLIIGTKMWDDPSQAELIVIGADPTHFRPDGTYVAVHNGRVRTILHGTYEVQRDYVCMNPASAAGPYRFGLFAGGSDRYLAVYPKPLAAFSIVMIAKDEDSI